jgi:biopolymer transport protein ExbB
MFNFIEKGGLMMYPIMFSSILAFAIFVERLIVLSSIKMLKKESLKEIFDKLEFEGISACKETVGSKKGAIKSFILSVLNENNEEVCEKAASGSGDDILFNLNKRVDFLAMLGSVTPLMGLLGTVIGMIKVFARVAEAGDLSDISILAGGIWEALITTAFGLAVAIPTLFAHNYLERKIEKIAHRMQQKALKIIAIMRRTGVFNDKVSANSK